MLLTVAFCGFVLLLSSACARPSRELCDEAATVIDQQHFISNGTELSFVTKACPEFAALRNRTMTTSIVRKRDVSQCSISCASTTCNTAAAQPAVADCDALTNALIALDETIKVPAGATVQVSNANGTCLYSFVNRDTVAYDVCSGSFGVLGQSAVTQCFDNQSPVTTITAGSCLSPAVSGNNFIVQSKHV